MIPADTKRPLRVCYFGTYRADYSRNHILIEGLRRNGVEVIECHQPLWKSIDDRVQAVSGGWMRPALWGRLLRAYALLFARFWHLDKNFDVLVCGYPGQFDVFPAWLFSRILRKPLVWDVFMSTWLIARERGLHNKSRFAVNALHGVEWLALRLPDLLIQDTAEYVRWFGQNFGLPSSRFRLVPTGSDSDHFLQPFLPSQSLPSQSTEANKPFTVLYYGSFIPNHGVPTIIEAAHLLRDETDIRFVLVGDGPERAQAVRAADRLALANVEFVQWLDQDQLVPAIAAADLALGAFGSTPQSIMTVQNKIYECLAVGVPVLTGDSAAVRAALRVGDEVAVCARQNPRALAGAIRGLRDQPAWRAYLAAQGNARFRADYTIEQLGARYRAHLLEAAGRAVPPRAAGEV